MEAHRKLMFAGLALLAVTALAYRQDAESLIPYVTGAAMLAFFVASFALFHRGSGTT